MAEREFADDELIAAHDLAWGGAGWNYPSRLSHAKERLAVGWACHLTVNRRVFLLALGVLPEGWALHHASDAIYVLYSKEHDQWVVTATAEGSHVAIHSLPWYWPEAVRSGQADIACRLIAARVELERRRAEKGKGM